MASERGETVHTVGLIEEKVKNKKSKRAKKRRKYFFEYLFDKPTKLGAESSLLLRGGPKPFVEPHP